MAVYRNGAPTAGNQYAYPFLVASVTSEQPRVSREANAIKVDGQLESSITTMRLELFKQQDCRAEFTCEVIAVDAKGRELVRTSHLLQQPSSPALDTAGEEGWTPAVAMHLVNLVQDLSTNMELMRITMEDYRFRISGMEDKAAAFEKDVTSSVVAVDKELSGYLKILENRMEDKMERLEDKLRHLEDKSSFTEGKILNKIDEKIVFDTSLLDKIESVENKLETQIGQLSKEDVSLLLSNISSITKNVHLIAPSIKSAIRENFKGLKKEIEEKDILSEERLRSSFTQTILNTTEHIKSRINQHLDSFEGRIEDRFTDLSFSINVSVRNIKSSFQETVNGMNITNADEVASAMTDIVAPKTCKRGMISLLTQPSYPYPVIKPRTSDSLTVPYLCDTVTDGGGWIIIQRRTTGNVDFYRNWADYKKGFGTLDDDFWLGNDNIHAITSSGQYELRIDLRYKGKSSYAHYDKFAILDGLKNYALTLGSYHGTTGDALSGHSGMPFTTFDRDNDSYGSNCAVSFTGAWWYGACHSSNLNGKWKEGGNKGPRWSTFSGDKAVSFSEMKIRQLDKKL